MKMFASILCAVVTATSAVSAADFVMIGKPGRVDIGFIGCKAKNDTTKIKSLIRANDKDAAFAYAVRRMPDCKALPVGTIGLVEDLSAWTGDTCLRQKGEPDCFWLPTNFVVAP